MATALQAQGIMISTLGSAVTRYMPLADTWTDFNQNLAETAVQVTYRTPGVLSKLWCRVETNSRNGSTTLRVRKNTANGNGLVTIPSSTTGQFEDVSNTDTVASGDNFALQLSVGGTSGSIQPRMYRTFFAADENTVKRHACSSSAGSSVTNTFFYSFGGRRDADNTVEANAQTYIPTDGTAKNFFLNISANTRNGTSTFRVRKNGGNGNQVLTVPATTTGIFEDTVNTDSFVAGDVGNFQYNNGGSSGSLTPNVQAIDYETTNSSFFMAWARPGGGNLAGESVSGHLAPSGEHNAAQGNDTRVHVNAGVAFLLSKLSVYIASNVFTDTGGLAATFRSRVNAAYGNLIISLGDGEAGRKTDLTNQDSISETALFNHRVDTFTGDGVGQLNWRNISLLVSPSVIPVIGIRDQAEVSRGTFADAARGIEGDSKRDDVVSSPRKDFLDDAC
jgi:hypothetical protein